mmetsp:Transcript_42647/g.84119  ORF Transcript_42647/g.84119 Transcript_42647/m.84119 type:complete len:276 (+) Transcript_42647:262-1089(+)
MRAFLSIRHSRRFRSFRLVSVRSLGGTTDTFLFPDTSSTVKVEIPSTPSSAWRQLFLTLRSDKDGGWAVRFLLSMSPFCTCVLSSRSPCRGMSVRTLPESAFTAAPPVEAKAVRLLILLLLTSRKERAVIDPQLTPSRDPSWFEARCNSFKAEREEKNEGTPANSFPPKSNFVNLVRLPKEGSIERILLELARKICNFGAQASSSAGRCFRRFLETSAVRGAISKITAGSSLSLSSARGRTPTFFALFNFLYTTEGTLPLLLFVFPIVSGWGLVS